MRKLAWMAVVVCCAAPAFAEEATEGDGEEEPLALIRVSSIPSGAEIIIDGHPCGNTPGLFSVTPGRHEVIVQSGDQRVRVVVYATIEAVADVTLEGAEPAEPEPPPPPPRVTGVPPMTRQATDEEPRHEEPEPEQEPWATRIPESACRLRLCCLDSPNWPSPPFSVWSATITR